MHASQWGRQHSRTTQLVYLCSKWELLFSLLQLHSRAHWCSSRHREIWWLQASPLTPGSMSRGSSVWLGSRVLHSRMQGEEGHLYVRSISNDNALGGSTAESRTAAAALLPRHNSRALARHDRGHALSNGKSRSGRLAGKHGRANMIKGFLRSADESGKAKVSLMC